MKRLEEKELYSCKETGPTASIFYNLSNHGEKKAFARSVRIEEKFMDYASFISSLDNFLRNEDKYGEYTLLQQETLKKIRMKFYDLLLENQINLNDLYLNT